MDDVSATQRQERFLESLLIAKLYMGQKNNNF